jgi:hypothetical protein
MNIPRRRIVTSIAGGILSLPLSALLQTLSAADTPRLDPGASAAKSLMYTHESTDANRICSGCQFYSDATASDWGPCVIFPDKLVSASGVCNSWFKRAG